MLFIDTHCHLYLPEFDHDRHDMIGRAVENGVESFFLPGIDSTVIPSMLSMEKNFWGKCFLMMGLHPCSVKENFREELAVVENWLSKRRFSAVGEIGLDFYWDKTHIDQQYEAFNLQMEMALEHQLPIVIHSRNATCECIDTVRPFAHRGLRGIFHCFGDSAALANEIADLGFFVGIGGVVTYKNSGLAEVVKQIPLEQIVLETDAPYLSPVPFRGKRNESSYLVHIAQKIAEAKGMSLDKIAEVTTANARRIFAPYTPGQAD